MTSHRLLTPIVTGLVLAAALPAAASAACPGETVRASELGQAATTQSVLCLINERRAAAGIGPVTYNAKLEAAAMVHSQDMVSRGYFAHTSPDGVDFIQRINDSGYTAGARTWLAGENLAWGSGSRSTPGALVQGWMDSPPHRANLLRDRFREIGIGVVGGTPDQGSDPYGVTVSSEYGFRAGAVKRAKKGRAASRKRAARKAARKAARRAARGR